MSGWREMTDEELARLSQDCDRRITELQSQGVQFFGVGEHYIQTLLEEQMSERQLAAAREKHWLWVKERLDAVESEIRSTLLRQKLGIAPTNGNGAGRG